MKTGDEKICGICGTEISDGFYKQSQTCFKFNEKDSCCNKEKCEELKAIEFLISDYKRLQEEFKQVDNECFRLEQKELRLEKENEELKADSKRLTDEYMIQKHLINAEFLSDYIPKQKIKDKIEEYSKIEKEMHENKNHGNDINKIYKYAVEEDKAKYGKLVLQDLLEEED